MQNQKIGLREKRVKYYYYDLDEDNHSIKKIFHLQAQMQNHQLYVWIKL